MTRPRSLQGRLLALVLSVVAGVWLLAAMATLAGTRHEMDELLDGHLAQAAALLVAQQVHPGDDPVAPDSPRMHRDARRVAFQVWHDGQLVLRSPNAPPTPMADHASGFADVTIGHEPWRVFAAHGAKRDVQVYVGELHAARHEILRGAMGGMLAPLLVGLPFLALVVWWAVRRGLAPLRRLSTMLAQRAPDALQPLALDSPGAELQTLTDALNALLQRIAGLLEAERRFTADAAHELRTPIAAVRTQAQVALAAEDDATRRHALQGTVEGCDRAARLVEQLLTLSRLETQGHAAQQRADLAVAARRAVADVAAQALARRQSIALDAPPHHGVAGDEVLLGVLVRNLVDNAIRYSPDGATIEVRLDATTGRLSVDDSGPGLDAAQRARLGERFFRVLGSGQSGSGLGWSIVRRIAQVHGLAVQADASPLGGLRVVVSGFSAPPAAPAAASAESAPAAGSRPRAPR